MARLTAFFMVLASVNCATAVQPEVISTTTEFRLCGKAEAQAFLSLGAEACHIVQLPSGQSESWIRFCGGVKWGPSFKVLGVGAGTELKGVGCFYVRFTPGTTQEAFKKMLSGSTGADKKAREVVVKEVKKYLNSLSDESLKQMGIERENIDSLEDVKFGPFKASPLNLEQFNGGLQKLECPKETNWLFDPSQPNS